MIKRLYEYLCNKQVFQVSKNELLENGFTDEELQKLKKDKVIYYDDNNISIRRNYPYYIYKSCDKKEGKRIKLYDYIFKNGKKEFTKEELLQNNFNEEDIKIFIDMSVIKLNENGYRLNSVRDYLTYNLSIIPIENTEKITYLLEGYDSLLMNLFFNFASKNDYYDAIKVFKQMSKSTCEEDIANNNLLIYVLANCTEELYEFYDYCQDFKLQDLLSNRKSDSLFYSKKIRKSIYEKDFDDAIQKLKDSDNYQFIDMLRRAKLNKKNKLSKLYEWIKNEDYDRTMNFFKNEEKKYNLNNYEKTIYYLVLEIRRMILSKRIPEIKEKNGDTIMSYVYSNDFRKARSMCTWDNLITYLLDKAIEQLEILEEKQKKAQSNGVKKNKNIDVILNIIKYGDFEFAKKIYDLYNYIPRRKYKNLIDDLASFKKVDPELFEYMCKCYNIKDEEEIKWCLDQIWNTVPEISDESFRILESHIDTENFEPKELLSSLHENMKYKKDVILLPPMEKEQMLEIKALLKKRDNFSGIKLKYEDKYALALLVTVRHSSSLRNINENSKRQFNDGEYNGCIDTTRLLLDYNKKNPSYHLRLAKSYKNIGDIDNAIKHFTIAYGLTENKNILGTLQSIKEKEKNKVLKYSEND